MDLEERVDAVFCLAWRVPVGLLSEVVLVVLRAREREHARSARWSGGKTHGGEQGRRTRPYMKPLVK